jgi:hypothetical protein
VSGGAIASGGPPASTRPHAHTCMLPAHARTTTRARTGCMPRW